MLRGTDTKGCLFLPEYVSVFSSWLKKKKGKEILAPTMTYFLPTCSENTVMADWHFRDLTNTTTQRN